MQEKYLRGVLGVDRETPGYIVRKEEQAESESGKESGKVWRQNGWNGRVQDTNGMLEKKGNEHGEEPEREKRVCQWRRGKIKSKRKMNKCRAEWKRQRHRQARKKGENQRECEASDRGSSGAPGEREGKIKKNDGEERENRCWMGGEERRCRMCYEEKETIEHMWNGNEREGEKAAGRNTEWRWKGDRMDERHMEEERQSGKEMGEV
jgi:hypothetical protein